jgi:hypothetical protein
MRFSGMTLFEVLIAMFVFLIGVVGVLSAMPVGVHTAQTVILQDAAIHLSRSKFTEFRRDRVNPPIDLKEGSAYLTSWQEPVNVNNWHDFASGAGQTYQYFDSIEQYEWKVDQDQLLKPIGISAAGNPAPPAGFNFPAHGSGTAAGVYKVVICVRRKSTSQEFRFVQYMADYNRVLPVDKAP